MLFGNSTLFNNSSIISVSSSIFSFFSFTCGDTEKTPIQKPITRDKVINITLISCSLGLNKFLVMPPAYYKYQDEGAIDFYTKIINQIPECKIILYNFEKLCGYKFSVKCVETLASKFPKQIIGVKDSTYNLFRELKIKNFSIFPGSELKLLSGLEIGCAGIITATCNATAELSRKVFDDFEKKKTQTANEKLCKVRKVFDQFNLISSLHSFLYTKDKKFENILPPLVLLSQTKKKELIDKLNKLEFMKEKNMAA